MASRERDGENLGNIQYMDTYSTTATPIPIEDDDHVTTAGHDNAPVEAYSEMAAVSDTVFPNHKGERSSLEPFQAEEESTSVEGGAATIHIPDATLENLDRECIQPRESTIHSITNSQSRLSLEANHVRCQDIRTRDADSKPKFQCGTGYYDD